MSGNSISYKAPTRIDLAGGTLDLWPLYNFFSPTVVVNMAIDLYATVTIRETGNADAIRLVSVDQEEEVTIFPNNPEKKFLRSQLPLLRKVVEHYAQKGGIEVTTDCMALDGSGLGGSSALNVGLNVLCNHYFQRGIPDEGIIELAKNLEAQLMGIPTGTQDYYPALYGGIEILHYTPEGIFREEVPIDAQKLQDRILLVYSHKPQYHGINNWDVYKGCIEGNHTLMEKLQHISNISLRMADALRKEEYDVIGHLLGEEWQKRRGIGKNISTPQIEELIIAGRQNGAISAKVCGAGGGGCVIFYCNEGKKDDVAEAIVKNGGKILDFNIVKKRPAVICE